MKVSQNTIINEIIIIGAGTSIKKAFSLLTRERLANKLVIVCNYAYKHFSHTFLVFSDRDFYKPRPEANNPDIYEELKQLPLIVGINDNGVEEFKLDNTILLDRKERENLTGILALKLAERIFKSGTIYLLGFDWTRRTGLPEKDANYNPNSDLQIHYYNDIKHRGVGYVGYYENHNPDNDFTKLIKKNVLIYNVSPDSNITCFPKISYEQFLKQLSSAEYNQEELRIMIRRQLCTS